MSALYNEFEPFAAQWIRNLAAAGHVAPGVVDERSIKEVQPGELGDGQVHLFAGIAIWSYALRVAGYPDSFPIWTASCPCQPFSAAGRGAGVDDPRHLWPDAFRLIEARRPLVVVGEQVGSKDSLGKFRAGTRKRSPSASGSAWIDLVQTDLERAGYAVGFVVFPAASVGAPHERHRLYWAAVRVADTNEFAGRQGRSIGGRSHPRGDAVEGAGLGRHGFAGGLADHHREGLVDAGDTGLEGLAGHVNHGSQSRRERADATRSTAAAGPTNGAWADVEWLPCRDGKWRPTQPGLFPLAHGAAQRVGRLRAYGNGLAAPQAAEFLVALKPRVEHLWRAA